MHVVISTQAKQIERTGQVTAVSPACSHYQVNATEWSRLPQAVKFFEKVLDFLKDRRRQTHAIESSDGKLQVFTYPPRGRKPAQIKRNRSERTTTITK